MAKEVTVAIEKSRKPKAAKTRKAQRVAKAKPKAVLRKGADKVQHINKVHAEAIESVPIITAEQAVSMGWTGQQLRSIANSLERIAKDRTNGATEISFRKSIFKTNPVKTTVHDLTNYNMRINFQRAREFRTLAKMVDMLNG